jgi:hypothetical protein
MLDGASAFTPVPVRASEYADKLSRHTINRLDQPDSDLRTVLADAISDTASELGLHSGESPSSTVTILRQTGDVVECLVLGDNLVVLPGHVLTDDRMSRFGARERARYRARLERGHGFDARHRQVLRELQTEQARHRNQPDGYWIAEADPEAAKHAIVSRYPITSAPWAVLATDGAYKTMTHLGIAEWSHLRLANGHELSRILLKCQTWEASSDPDGRNLPRAKRHDDKSLAVATFAT